MSLCFKQDIHKYFYDDQPELSLVSVSKLLENYHEKFDSNKISKKVAEKKGKTQQEVLNEWKEISDKSLLKGSLYHSKREEELLSKESVHRHKVEGDLKIGLDLDNLLSGIYPELILDHPYYGLVGTADKVELFRDGTFDLSDYKTSSKIEFQGFMVFDPVTKQRYEKKMYTPVSHLPDANGIHYSLQISLYAFFLEERGYTPRDLWIEHIIFDEEEDVNIVKYPINYLRKEAKAICEHFKNNRK